MAGTALTVCGVAVADRSRDERRWYDTLLCLFDHACGVVQAWRGLLWLWRCWQSVEQRRREVEAADAASVARLVRGVCCCHFARNAPLLCLYWSYVCCGCGGVVRRMRV